MEKSQNGHLSVGATWNPKTLPTSHMILAFIPNYNNRRSKLALTYGIKNYQRQNSYITFPASYKKKL